MNYIWLIRKPEDFMINGAEIFGSQNIQASPKSRNS